MSQDLSINAGHARQSQYGHGAEGLRTNIRQLIRAVGSGDLNIAQNTFDQLRQHPAASGRSPLRNLLDALAQPLQDGDIGAARDALAALHDNRPPPGPEVHGEQTASHERAKVRDAVRNLIEALRGDELDDAQLAYAQLIELSDVEEHGLNGPFGQLLTDIGEALTAGDPDSANTLFATFARGLDPGSAVDLNA